MGIGWGEGLLGLIGSIYFFLLYPLAALYKCGKNKSIGWFFKLCWIVAVSLVGPLAAAVYFLRHPSSKASRVIAVCSVIFMLLFAVESIRTLNRTVESVSQDMAESLSPEKLEKAFQPAVAQTDRRALIQHATDIRSEMASLSWWAALQRLSLFAVEQSLVDMRAQGVLSADDVRFWESLYMDRNASSFLDLELRIHTRALSEAQI
jgi:hypothetical protein